MKFIKNCFDFLLGVDANVVWPICLVLAIVLCLGGGIGIGVVIYKSYAKKTVGGVKEECERMKKDARDESKTYLKEAKEEQNRLRKELDNQSKEQRAEIARSEQRVAQREDQLIKREMAIDKKSDLIDEKKKQLESKERELDEIEQELQNAHANMLSELEKVAKLTQEEAKQILMDELLDDAKKDAVVLVKEIEQKAKDEADKKAKNIIGLAIQRCSADHASEIAVSVVELPNEDMKGRLIGRVGRNIRAIENSTGVDLIIDDTPDVVTVSGFDPVRREIAKLTIERLVSDGRIHPAKIEETVDKVKREIEQQMKEAGENAAFEANVYGLHPEIIKLLGRLKFRTSYGQNVLKHSLEVSYLAGMMAAELGADVKVAKRAGLLHDIGKAVDHEVEGTHVTIGVDIAKKFKEQRNVIHAIEAHHGDVEPQTLEAIIVQAADSISGARPGARRESLENYVKRLEKLEGVANSFEGVEQSYAIQAGREIRVIVKPEVVNDEATTFMAKEIAKKIEAELEYPGQIKVNVIREVRQVEYAK
ncbi:MAG: ribonuclease Y [Clostridia bacterium]|nr:ribonuclease Y [Clostridia bacterium]